MNIENELRKVGLKITGPRIKILQVLKGADKSYHMSAEDVYKALIDKNETIGLATVYRVLTQFEASGLVTRHHFEDDYAVYELANSEHHDHLICIKCRKVTEFVDDTIEQQQKRVTQKVGFKMTHHSLNIYGVCGKCQKRSLG